MNAGAGGIRLYNGRDIRARPRRGRPAEEVPARSTGSLRTADDSRPAQPSRPEHPTARRPRPFRLRAGHRPLPTPSRTPIPRRGPEAHTAASRTPRSEARRRAARSLRGDVRVIRRGRHIARRTQEQIEDKRDAVALREWPNLMQAIRVERGEGHLGRLARAQIERLFPPSMAHDQLSAGPRRGQRQ